MCHESTRLVTSPATAKSKSKSSILKSKSKSKSTLSGQVQVRVQVLFKKGKSKSKSKSSKKRTCKQFYPIPILFLLLLLSKSLYRTQKKLILKYCYLQPRCHPYTVHKLNSFLHKYFVMLKWCDANASALNWFLWHFKVMHKCAIRWTGDKLNFILMTSSQVYSAKVKEVLVSNRPSYIRFLFFLL